MFKPSTLLLNLSFAIVLATSSSANGPGITDYSLPESVTKVAFEIDTAEIVSQLTESTQRRLDHELRFGWMRHAWEPPAFQAVERFEVAEDTTAPSR